MTDAFEDAEQAPRLTLASASPRRRELLAYLGLRFDAVATTGEEQELEPPPAVARALPAFPLEPSEHPTLLAWRKTRAAADEGCRGMILGADTIVVIDGTVLGKPRDSYDAERMLRILAGRTHSVYTGLAVGDARDLSRSVLDLVRSDVTMAPLDDDEIAAYVASGEPLDKAGAYGIQGLGGRLVQQVTGSYTSVVGLPIIAVHRLLSVVGIVPPVEPADAFRRWLADQGKDLPACIAP